MDDIIVKRILQMPITDYKEPHNKPMYIMFNNIETESKERLVKLFIKIMFPQLPEGYTWIDDFGISVFSSIKKAGTKDFIYDSNDLINVLKHYESLERFNKLLVNIPIKPCKEFPFLLEDLENSILELETRPLKILYTGPALTFHPEITLMAHFEKLDN